MSDIPVTFGSPVVGPLILETRTWDLSDLLEPSPSSAHHTCCVCRICQKFSRRRIAWARVKGPPLVSSWRHKATLQIATIATATPVGPTPLARPTPPTTPSVTVGGSRPPPSTSFQPELNSLKRRPLVWRCRHRHATYSNGLYSKPPVLYPRRTVEPDFRLLRHAFLFAQMLPSDHCGRSGIPMTLPWSS
jgi:hypothetical protein